MRAEYTYDYHHTRCTDECESIEEAAGRAYADEENCTAIPIEIKANGETIFKRPHWYSEVSEELRNLANYPAAPESDSAP